MRKILGESNPTLSHDWELTRTFSGKNLSLSVDPVILMSFHTETDTFLHGEQYRTYAESTITNSYAK